MMWPVCAADYFCQRSGYAGAKTFGMAQMRPTLVLADNKRCDASFCVGFTSIECHR